MLVKTRANGVILSELLLRLLEATSKKLKKDRKNDNFGDDGDPNVT